MADDKKEAKPAKPEAPAAKPDADRILELEAKLEAQSAQIDQLLLNQKAGAINAVDAQQDARSKAETDALRKEVEKGNQQRTQEVADRKYEYGKHRFKCVLADGNRHPEISVRADNEVDAKARYLDVCGILAAEKPVQIERV